VKWLELIFYLGGQELAHILARTIRFAVFSELFQPDAGIIPSSKPEVLAASIIRAMMEAESTSETSVIFVQTTWRNNPEDSRLHTRRRENLKSHQDIWNLRALQIGLHDLFKESGQ
jgi:hypothetical protein